MERKWVIGAFLDISGFRSWTYRAATSPEIKEKFLHQFYAIMEWWVLNHVDCWSKYEGDAIITVKEFTEIERKNAALVLEYIKALGILLRKAQGLIRDCEAPPPGVRMRIMEGYTYKFMVLDPNDAERKRRIAEYVEYCINTLRGLLGVNPEHPAMATIGVVKAMGRSRSTIRVRPLGTPSYYPKGVNREDVDTLQILKFY